jgi:outer membrane immunogenic protein
VTRFVHTEQRLDWLATFRGRIGVLAAPQLLLYATGGLAVGQVKTNSSLTTTVANNIPACVAANVGLCMASSDTATKVGWTVGGGAVWALTSNWSVKAEYLYVDLGRSNSTGFDTRFTPPLPLFASTKDYFSHRPRRRELSLRWSRRREILSSPEDQQSEAPAFSGAFLRLLI